MRYVCLALLITGSAALAGCSNSNDNDGFTSQAISEVAIDQAKAVKVVSQVEAVIAASGNLDNAEPQDISRITLDEANLAEPVAVTGANASL